MLKILTVAIALTLAWAAPAMADKTGKTPAPAAAKVKCKVAEVHPITGHLECVDPPGAPIEQPKKRLLPPCPPEKPGDKKSKEWVVQTNCVKPTGKDKQAGHDHDADGSPTHEMQ